MKSKYRKILFPSRFLAGLPRCYIKFICIYSHTKSFFEHSIIKKFVLLNTFELLLAAFFRIDQFHVERPDVVGSSRDSPDGYVLARVAQRYATVGGLKFYRKGDFGSDRNVRSAILCQYNAIKNLYFGLKMFDEPYFKVLKLFWQFGNQKMRFSNGNFLSYTQNIKFSTKCYRFLFFAFVIDLQVWIDSRLVAFEISSVAFERKATMVVGFICGYHVPYL